MSWESHATVLACQQTHCDQLLLLFLHAWLALHRVPKLLVRMAFNQLLLLLLLHVWLALHCVPPQMGKEEQQEMRRKAK
jgi:hypothetical protein